MEIEKQFAESAAELVDRYRQLLVVGEALFAATTLDDLFARINQHLVPLLEAKFLALVLYTPDHSAIHRYELYPFLVRRRRVRFQPGSVLRLSLSRDSEAMILPDLRLQALFPDLHLLTGKVKLPWWCLAPLRAPRMRYGALLVGREQSRLDLLEREFFQRAGVQVALAIEMVRNSGRSRHKRSSPSGSRQITDGSVSRTLLDQTAHLNYLAASLPPASSPGASAPLALPAPPADAAPGANQALARERDRLRLLLDVNNAIVSTLDMPDVFAAICAFCRDVVHHEYTSLALLEKETNSIRLFALDFPQSKGHIIEDMVVGLSDSPASMAITRREAVRFDVEVLHRSSAEICKLILAEGLQSGVCFPLATRNAVLGTLNVASFRPDAFSGEDVELLGQVAGQVAIAIENVLAYCENEELRNKLAEEKLYLEDEIRSAFHFEEIIGDSPGLKQVLKEVQNVAPTDTGVLLLGETGTGKEIIARAIHSNSSRSAASFVKINCSAIPAGLLESELFGHERGSFTGAIAQRLGRFELAHHGTIFLDEIGDVPLELQPKLLRVLQEQEFERLGGTRTIRVDVRVVAATNRDLSAMVASRQFRSDLFYRLNVFPILIPPLRERTEDIPALARFFAGNYSRRMNKRIESIPAEAMEALVRYPWPGNIRELENLVERAVILSPGTVLKIPVAELAAAADAAAGSGKNLSTLAEAERGHILRALEQTQWVLGGPAGAAKRLGMKRTTLQSRMAKLGIAKPL